MIPKNLDERKRIGAEIAAIRKSKGLSQQKLAEISGVTYANVSRIELGKYSVGFDTLNRLAEILGCKVELVKKKH